MLAVDISNYTSPLTESNLAALQAEGVEHVIIQAIDPPPGYPPGHTRDQIQKCFAAGLSVDAYVWLWFSLGLDDIRHKLQLLEGLPVRQVWLDVEDTGAVAFTTVECEQKLLAALELCDGFPVVGGGRAGVYSGRWFWTDRRYLANSTVCSDRELWDANYDDQADAALGFRPYGGWTPEQVRIKQYHGTTSLAGISGLDLNVLSVGEAAELRPPDTGRTIDSLLNVIGVMAGDLCDSLANTGDALRDINEQAHHLTKALILKRVASSGLNVDSVVRELRRLRQEA